MTICKLSTIRLFEHNFMTLEKTIEIINEYEFDLMIDLGIDYFKQADILGYNPTAHHR